MRFWELDFDARTATERNPADRTEPSAAGRFRWLDTTIAEIDLATLTSMVPNLSETVTDELMRELELGDGWLAFGLSEPPTNGESGSGVNVLLSHGLLVTLEFGVSETLARLRQTWRDDFERFAQSSGFFLFELSDHYTAVAQRGVHALEARIQTMQGRLFSDDGEDSAFTDTAGLIQRLQELRQHTVSAQETFEELATRSSPFIGATTQPFIGRNAVRMERLATELLQQRDSLMSALNLYIGMTGHRTGRVLQRLTVFSMIFLPISFLAGVFGMNFEWVPGLTSPAGFWMFCATVVVITTTMVFVARRSHWF